MQICAASKLLTQIYYSKAIPQQFPLFTWAQIRFLDR